MQALVELEFDSRRCPVNYLARHVLYKLIHPGFSCSCRILLESRVAISTCMNILAGDSIEKMEERML